MRRPGTKHVVALALVSLGALLAIAVHLASRPGDGGAGVAASDVEAPRAAAAPDPAGAGAEAQPTARDRAEPAAADAGDGEDTADAEGERAAQEAAYDHDIEEIKAQIYAREIESVDRLHLLDEVVQTGDMDTREYWRDGWSGVDDWKRYSDGFDLETGPDGTLIFVPGEEAARNYTFLENIESYEYDPEHQAFVSEVDYYGKTIQNVLKFVNDDVLVRMTISGYKVDLNIYQRDGAQP